MKSEDRSHNNIYEAELFVGCFQSFVGFQKLLLRQLKIRLDLLDPLMQQTHLFLMLTQYKTAPFR